MNRPVLHPKAGEGWFKALPHEHRARMNREWRSGLDRDRELDRSWVRRSLKSSSQMAALFLVFDPLCSGSSWGTCLLALATGGALGMLLHELRAARFLSGILGLLCFCAFQCSSRGGFAANHLFWLLPVAAISAHLGVEREEQ